MFSNISPYHYHNQEVFEKEKSQIFHNNWIFVAFGNDLLNHNDFVTKTIGGIPIVIQNFNGNIKAFMNVCSHRFSTIQNEEKGNRALFCPYHGWSFDKEGMPNGIPKKPLFKDFSKKELCDLKLKEYNLDVCGDLYFIHISKPTNTLKEYLGSFYGELEMMSKGKSKLIDTNNINIKSNWKILVENTLESYHVNLVHSETFKSLGAKGLVFDFTENHSNWDAELTLGEDDPKLNKIHKMFSERPYKINGYRHFLIYPNLLISSSYGVSFNFSIINPINPSKSDFISYVFLSESNKKSNFIDIYSNLLIDFNRKVFDEDKSICEQVQRGVVVTDKPGVLSLEEERVHAFQKTYINQIK